MRIDGQSGKATSFENILDRHPNFGRQLLNAENMNLSTLLCSLYEGDSRAKSYNPGWLLFFLSLFLLPSLRLHAEGSVDFFNYPGYRMFLDTRDAQQLKVYANVGEFINVGASHVGIQGGFIAVYRPDGTLHSIFDNSGTSTGKGIIFNSIQELNGPTGGGTMGGPGYAPGTIEVQNGEEGIWTVVFDYPSYTNAGFNNIFNNAPWTRANNQPNSRRVVLAWDITVSQNGAGNEVGSTLLTGRVYSNEHISLINGNGFETSPTFYVLTRAGFLYQVDIKNADPFRFPISSNSRGLVKGLTREPVYQSRDKNSFIRNSNPNSWVDSVYLYEPQARDIGNMVNNKIFFNPPNPDMPGLAKVTDIYRMDSHQTWLNTQLQLLQVDSVFFNGDGCDPGYLEFGLGGYFIFNLNANGRATVFLDIDNNGSFHDSVDVKITGELEAPSDTIFWDGKDGFGNPLPFGNYTIPYTGKIRFGEIHIALSDVENNFGGVTFTWMNAPPTLPDSLFYYDHSFIGGAVSGGGTPGNPLPTTQPFTYMSNFGNDKYLDQWTFVEAPLDTNTFQISVVSSCPCSYASPQLSVVNANPAVCEGETALLQATNDTTGIGNVTFTWTGPNGFFFEETLGDGDTSKVSIPNVTATVAGQYMVVLLSDASCGDTAFVNLSVSPTPVIGNLAGGGTFCAGAATIITASNTVAGIPFVTYSISGPNGVVAAGTANGTELIQVVIDPLTVADGGTYTIVLTSDQGCVSEPATIDIAVEPTPSMVATQGGGAFCENEDVTLSAVNTTPGINTMICTWTGPNGFFNQQNLGGADTTSIDLTNVDLTLSGTYTVICESNGCSSVPLDFEVDVNATPEINAISPNGTFCEGVDVLLTAQNVTPGTGPITYTWTGPNGFMFTGTAPEPGPFTALLTNLTQDMAGEYTLILSTEAGCLSTPQSVQIDVDAAPVLCNGSGEGDYCVGQTVTLSAENCASDTAAVAFTWTGPNGFVQTGIAVSPFTLELPDIQLNQAGTYCLQLQSIANACQSNILCFNVGVDVGLVISNITPDSTYCEGDNVVLTATNTLLVASDIVYTWTGPNGFIFTDTVPSDGALTVTIPNILVDQAGEYILNVVSLDGCAADPDTVIVNVDPGIINMTISGGGAYCSGTPAQLSCVAESSAPNIIYVWTDSTGAILQVDTLPTGDTSVLNVPIVIGMVYTCTATAIPTGNCSDFRQAEVSVISVPEILNLTVYPDTVLCSTDTLIICAENAVAGIDFDYTWTTPNGTLVTGTASGNEIFCDTFAPVGDYGSGTYTLVISNQGCLDMASVDITVNETPVLSPIFGATEFCQGDSVPLVFWNTNVNVDSFLVICTLPDGSVVVQPGYGLDTIYVSLDQPGLFCCKLVTPEGCESNESCATFSVINLPTPEVPDTIELCDSEILELTGTANGSSADTISYTWTGPGGFLFTGTAPASGPFPATDPTPETGLYCLVLSTSGNSSIICESDSACTMVIVHPTPEIDGIDGGGEFCDNQEVILSATVTIADGSVMNYEWTLDGTTVESGTVASGETLTLAAQATGEYCLIVTSDFGCADTACTSASFLLSPDLLEVTGDGDYCEGESVELSGMGTPGPGTVIYTWTGPNNFMFTGTAPNGGPYTAVRNNLTLDDSGLYFLDVSLDNGCPSDTTLSVEVIVNPVPVVDSTIGDGQYCEGELVTFGYSINVHGADTTYYTVNGPGLNTNGIIVSDTTLLFETTITPSTTGTYTLSMVTSDSCESQLAFVVLGIREIDPAVLMASNTLICAGESLQLSTNEQVGAEVTYEWYKDGVLIATTTEPFLDIPDPMSGVYTVLALVDGCSDLSDDVSITVLAAPNAANDAFEGEINVPVNGNILGNDSPSVGDDISITILTQPEGGTLSVDANGNMVFTPDQNFVGTTQFDYEICLLDCPELCDDATVTIKIIQLECIVPNIITPNGDGVNDVVFIGCLEGESFPNNSFRVFNRWGDEIYSAAPYNNDWSGTYGKDKKELPAGTYFYLFQKDKDTSEPEAGYIRIVR